MFRAPEAVIFDCGGVLIDSEFRMVDLWVAELNRLGAGLSHCDYAGAFLGLSDAEYLSRIDAHFGREVDREPLYAIERQERAALEGVPAIAGMLELVVQLTVPSCVASSSPMDRLHATLGGAGFLPLFEGRLFNSAMVARGKPAPDLFLHAATQLGAQPSRCVVVEDSVHGIAAAKAGGMRVIGFAAGSHMFPPVIERLRALEPDAMAANAAELAKLVSV
jgi:HAD superfamily hydrolase (TIGR01509 family)